MTKRIVVIGGVAAGPSAAGKAVRVNPDTEVVLFEEGEHVSYGVCEIPYFVKGEVPREGLLSTTPARLREAKGIDVRILHRVEEIRPVKKTLDVRDLRTGRTTTERYDRLIIATGSTPRRLGVPGEDGTNIFRVKTPEEAVLLRRAIDEEEPKRAVIIGGGYIGVEMAEALCRSSIEVTVLHSRTLPLTGLEEPAQEHVRLELERNGVQFVPRVTTDGFDIDPQHRVRHVVTSAGSFPADIVIIAAGVAPNARLAQEAGVRVGAFGGILADRRQQTNIDDLYAAGDCCEVKNVVTGAMMYVPLATVASRTGRVAGENAAGGKAVFRGVVRARAVKVFDTEVAQAGITLEEARQAGFDAVSETVTASHKVAVMPGSTKLTVKLVADRRTGKLLGAGLWGGEGAVLRANTLAVAIQHGLTIDDIRGWDLAYAPPFSPLWDPMLVAANAVRKKL